MNLNAIRKAVESQGLSYRGAFHPEDEDLPEGVTAKTLILVGFLGAGNWRTFSSSPEIEDGNPDPLDRWSRRVIAALANQFDAKALFPFVGPPWWPFQIWAQKAEPVHPSPIGMLIHPDYGLWHAWRGALAFRERIALPAPDRRASPCDSCREKPCLSTCPVNAFTPEGYNVTACAAHIGAPGGAKCMTNSCLARLACPIGVEHRYGRDQAHFHMKAFLRAQGD